MLKIRDRDNRVVAVLKDDDEEPTFIKDLSPSEASRLREELADEEEEEVTK